MQKTILFVDDEPQILKALRRSFIDTNYTILTANSGLEALEIIKTNTVDLVISDMRMPQMDGYELLKRIKQYNQDIIRIILSGYTDEKIVYKALLNNLAKSYLFKPWNNDELIQMVHHIFEVGLLLEDSNLSEIVQNQEDLPAPKATYGQLISLIEADASTEEISKIIEADQAICSRVLRISNSAFYGIKTSSIKQAITYIGLNNIKDIVLSCSIFENLRLPKALEAYRNLLWRHASATSYYMSALYAKVLNQKMPIEAFTVGILHDLGKVVILQKYPETAIKLYEQMHHYDEAVSRGIELNELGFEHEKLGGFLLEWWDFPFAIVEAALYHHDPLNTNVINKTLIAALSLADECAQVKIGIKPKPHYSLEVLDALGISYNDMDKFYQQTEFNVQSE